MHYYSEFFFFFFLLASIDENMECTLVVQALRINTLSKLTFSDSVTFDNLVLDVFPGIKFKDIEFEIVADAFREVCTEQNLIVNETQVSVICVCNNWKPN